MRGHDALGRGLWRARELNTLEGAQPFMLGSRLGFLDSVGRIVCTSLVGKEVLLALGAS